MHAPGLGALLINQVTKRLAIYNRQKHTTGAIETSSVCDFPLEYSHCLPRDQWPSILERRSFQRKDIEPCTVWSSTIQSGRQGIGHTSSECPLEINPMFC